MKLIVGLGNPGRQYERTRHNVGFRVLDALVARHAPGAVAKGRFNAATYEARVADERCVLIKPGTFMNRSGQSVSQALSFYKLDPASDLLVIVDDTALPTGQIRCRQSGGTGGHNGLADIQRALGTSDYARVRVGIDAKPAVMDLADYVLGRFTPEQETMLGSAIDRGVEAAEVFVKAGIKEAMNRFNEKARNDGDSQSQNKKESKGNGGGGHGASQVHPGWLDG